MYLRWHYSHVYRSYSDLWLWLSQYCFTEFFISSNASICSTLAFPPLGNSDRNVVSATNCFPSKRKENTPFHHTAFYYSCVNWNGLSDHLIDALFSLYQQSKSFESKVNFKQAKFLEAAKLAYYNKTKDSNTFQKLGSRNHWEIPNSVFNKGKPAIPPLKKIVW